MFLDCLQRIASVARKEFLHILRDRVTLTAMITTPVIQMFLLGYAINTNVRDIPTVVLDEAGTQESRALLQRFENSKSFKFIDWVYSEDELNHAIISGRARVGVKIPENYSRRLAAGATAQLLVLVDGSDSTVAGEAVNVSNGLILSESLERILADRVLPLEARPRVMFNPDMRSTNYFIPGLIIMLTQIMTTMLAANAIVREKENGTLEQFFMTPVKPIELILGKMAPYLVFMTFVFCLMASVMRLVFAVPIHGPFSTLLALVLPFMLTMLALGLWISTRVKTRDAAAQLASATYMPAMFLSGYVFPVGSMPTAFQYLSQVIPTTWMVDAARGIILRGADLSDLRMHALVLWSMAPMAIFLSTLRFRKRVA